MKIRVHLTNGQIVEGAESDNEEIPEQSLEAFKSGLTDELSRIDKSWGLDITLPNGNWAAFPGSSVLWVELVDPPMFGDGK